MTREGQGNLRSMASEERQLHVQSPTGAILTRYWPGAHRAAYSPLTHYLVAAKSLSGLVLVRPQDGKYWGMPGGPLPRDADVKGLVEARFLEQTGLRPRQITLVGHFRIVLSDRVEYGALIVAASDPPRARHRQRNETLARTWNFSGELEGLDPISATLATVACSSRTWESVQP